MVSTSQSQDMFFFFKGRYTAIFISAAPSPLKIIALQLAQGPMSQRNRSQRPTESLIKVNMHHGLISASQNLLQLCAYQMMLKHIILNLIISHGSVIKRLNNLANFFCTHRHEQMQKGWPPCICFVYVFSQARCLERNVCMPSFVHFPVFIIDVRIPSVCTFLPKLFILNQYRAPVNMPRLPRPNRS